MTAEGPTAAGRAPWLTRTLVVLTLVSLTQDAASELLYPLLPALLTGVLAAPPVVLGAIEGAADATAGLTRYVAGRWSDRRGRRPFVTAGYSLAALGKVLVAAAGAWPVVLAGRVVDRFGKGMRSAPRDALLAAAAPPGALGRTFGFHRAGDSLGAAIGPLLGLLALAAADGDVRTALWWAVIPAVLSALLTLAIREPARRDMATAPPSPPGPMSHQRTRRRTPSPLPGRFWRLTAALTVVAVVNVPDVLVLLRVSQVGFTTTQVVLVYAVYNLVYAAGAYPAGALTDRWPRPLVYAVGLLAFGIGYIGLGLVDAGPAVVLLAAVYGLFPAFTDGVGKAWVSALVPDEHRGRAQGVVQAFASGAVLVAGLWAGALWSTGPGDGTVPLVASGTVGLLAAAAFTAVAVHRRPGSATQGTQRRG